MEQRLIEIREKIKNYKTYLEKLRFYEADWVDNAFYEDECRGITKILEILSKEKNEVEVSLRNNRRSSTCIECGDFIGERRLKMMPFTDKCVECANSEEQGHYLVGA